MKPESESKPKKERGDGLHKRRGIWHFALRVDGQRRSFSTKTRDFDEAKRIKRHAENDLEAGKLPNNLSKWSFRALLAEVLEQRKLYLSTNSVRIDKERSVRLLKHFGDMRVGQIDIAAVRKYQQARSVEVSTRTVNMEVNLLSRVLREAKRWSSIASDYKRLPETRSTVGRALTDQQEKLLLDTAKTKPGWHVAFLCAMLASNSAMRSVEIKNLRLRDVDLLSREVNVRRSKTNAGLRTIPLNAAGVWAAARLLERANALGSTQPEHFLLPGFLYRSKLPNRGTGFDPNRNQKGWRSAWRALVKKTAGKAGSEADAAVFRGLRFHDLRHCAITKLAESEASDATIMAIAGHMTREMMEHYSHIRGEAKRKAVDALPSYIPAEATPAIEPTSKRVQ